MTGLAVLALLVYTFGAFALGAMALLWVRELGRSRRSMPARSAAAGSPADYVSGALLFVSFLWFLVNGLIVLLGLGGVEPVALRFVGLWLAFLFPPLIMHVSREDILRTVTIPLSPVWGWIVAATYGLSLGSAAAFTLGLLGLGGFPVETVSVASTAALGVLFTSAALVAVALTRTRPATPVSEQDVRTRRWWTTLFLLIIPVFALLVASRFWPDPAPSAAFVLEIAAKSLPLVFMFVGTYLENRYEFFDLFVKRGLALIATTLVLAVAFTSLLPFLQRYDGSPAAPWAYAVVMLPIVLALPWLHARVSSLLDRHWLGRRFTTLEAVTRFLGGLRSATTEAQLASAAQKGLGDIFSAPVTVRTSGLTAAAAADFEIVQEVPARLGDEVAAWFLMGRRTSEAPYFSEDIVLLRSLADVFASVLHNLQLRMREQDQERRAQELSLHASRSELKALRAQINPHFLFNALNAIAGLIPREPARADRTIERLAEVFRYALRGADSEWARLEDEFEFARAYLDVEQARFGARLQTDIRLADDVRGARIPTMMVQTLVENAVKHGAALVRDRAVVTIDGRIADGRLRLVVSDNGPGFDPDRRAGGARRGGYGLTNIRQRLEGYFGSEAVLTIDRDRTRALTVASIVLPVLMREPQTVLTGLAEGAR